MQALSRAMTLVLLVGALGRPAWAQPTSQPLVQKEHLVFLGEFKLPSAGTANGAWAGDADALNYGGPGLTVLPNGNLVVGCHRQHDKLAVVTIPPIGGTAEVVIPCTNVGLGNIGPGNKTVGGGLVFNNRLILSQFIDYDAAAEASASHTWRNLDLTGTAAWQRIGTLNPGFYGGYMALIPEEWRALFGAPAVTGLCCVSIISRSSYGPALFAFNPDDLDKARTVPATPLVYYSPEDRALGGAVAGSNNGPPNERYNWSTNIRGVAFPPGTRSVLFIGRHGMGKPCYGEAAQCADDPVDRGKGNHAYPYRHQIWAYDATDLLAVKNRQKQPWQVQPYAIIPLLDMAGDNAQMWGGAAYDPATKRLYVATDFYESPRIFVYQLEMEKKAPQGR